MPPLDRILDANLNRAREGLRVLEEIARFLLDDPRLSSELKRLRHMLAPRGAAAETALLSGRAAGQDVGANSHLATEDERADLASVLAANARRVQESLRVLEEFAKLPDVQQAGDADFKEMRFTLYELERELAGRLLRRERAAAVRGLYAIIDPALGKGRGAVELARAALAGGARVIQLRDKQLKKGQLLPVACALRELCAEAGAIFVVNDDLDVAVASRAHGLHLGQKDLPLAVARRMLPIDTIVGVSTATLEEALAAQRDGADYIAVGAIYPTSSKDDTRPARLETLRRVAAAVSAPLVAIGGINEDNVAPVVRAGAAAAAVISAVIGAKDVAAAARRLTERIERAKAGEI